MRYKAKYRVRGRWFWRKVKNIVGDGTERTFRFFVLEDGSQVHYPLDSEVIFSKEREEVIRKNKSKEIGHKI